MDIKYPPNSQGAWRKKWKSKKDEMPPFFGTI
jgi:hypothetical protein